MAFLHSETRDHKVAFNSEHEGTEIHVEHALDARYGTLAADDTDVECEIIYAVQAYDSALPGYVSLDAFKQTLEAEWGRQVYSWIEFNKYESEIYGYLLNEDYDEHIDRFAIAGTDPQVYALKLRVVAMVLESESSGPATSYDSLPSVEIMFKLVASEAANGCLDNTLALSELLPTGVERESNTFEYTCATTGSADTPLTVTGNAVVSINTACETETVAEYKKVFMTESGVEEFEWIEIKSEPGKATLGLDSMYFEYTFDQD
jgi:hypothetical protein